MTIWSLEGGRLFPVEDQLEQKQRTEKDKACFVLSPALQERALYFLGEERGGLYRQAGGGGGGRDEYFLALGRGKCSRTFSTTGSDCNHTGDTCALRGGGDTRVWWGCHQNTLTDSICFYLRHSRPVFTL